MTYDEWSAKAQELLETAVAGDREPEKSLAQSLQAFALFQTGKPSEPTIALSFALSPWLKDGEGKVMELYQSLWVVGPYPQDPENVVRVYGERPALYALQARLEGLRNRVLELESAIAQQTT